MFGGATIGTFSLLRLVSARACVPFNNNARLVSFHENNLH